MIVGEVIRTLKRLEWVAIFSYLLVGFATVIFGALLPELLRFYGQNYSDGGKLVFLQFAGFLIGVLITPSLSQRLGYWKTILFAFIILFFVHSLFFLRPLWYLVLMLAAFNGFGFGVTQTAVGTMLLESKEDQKAVIMSRLEVSFGIGALLMPILSSVLIVKGAWSASFMIVGFFALIMTIIWSHESFRKVDTLVPTPKNKDGFPTVNSYDKRAIFRLMFFMCFLFLYVGIETSIINFLPSILIKQIEISSYVAGLSVTLFWVAMVIGRIFAGVLAEKIKYYRFLFFSNLGALIFIANISVVKNTLIIFLLVFLVGLFLSGIFSITLVFADKVFPGTTKRTTSNLIASGGIGGAVLPLLMGWSMDRLESEYSIWVLIGFTSVMFLILTAMGLLKFKDNKASETVNHQKQL
jgi:MFS transporter, FHS family, glucose/mannose:H+ symporter